MASDVAVVAIRNLPWDDKRGSGGMWFFILTEAMLFISMFFAYFYLGRDQPRWPIDEPPKLLLASIMLAVLLSSSAVLRWAEQQGKAGRVISARIGVLGTVVLGVSFLILQSFEYKDHLRKLLPTQDAYASIFYTITTIHAAHVFTGLLMLAYVLVLPRVEHSDRPPHRALHNAGLYWHFVDLVWVFIVCILYYLPHWK